MLVLTLLLCSLQEQKLESSHLHHALRPMLNLPLPRLPFVASFFWGTQRTYFQVHGKQNKVLSNNVSIVFTLNLIIFLPSPPSQFFLGNFEDVKNQPCDLHSMGLFPSKPWFVALSYFSKFVAK